MWRLPPAATRGPLRGATGTPLAPRTRFAAEGRDKERSKDGCKMGGTRRKRQGERKQTGFPISLRPFCKKPFEQKFVCEAVCELPAFLGRC